MSGSRPPKKPTSATIAGSADYLPQGDGGIAQGRRPLAQENRRQLPVSGSGQQVYPVAPDVILQHMVVILDLFITDL
jgi:hypothetical protein